MKNLLDEDQALPEGLWLIKWIDCISLGRGFLSSPRIHVILQKLDQPDTASLNRLSQRDVAYLIGRRSGQPATEVATWAQPRPVLTGMLPLLKIGDVVRGTRLEGTLRQREATISLSKDTDFRIDDIFKKCDAPKDWSGTWRTINRFEYELGAHREVAGSRCMVVRVGKIEYLIPCSVILRTFYGFHTKLANAICSGPWEIKSSQVISTAKFKSGIGTYRHAQTGAWNIVLQAGLTREHAVRLAALYFDEYARACANGIYASAGRQTHGVPAGGDRHWFVDAKIPYRWSERPFTMRVKGFPLRAHRPSAADGVRFLVTRIDATSWPFPDQEICSELFNSNRLSPDQDGEKVNKPYRKGHPPPVPADEGAELDHQTDAFKGAAENHADADDFRFLNEPRHLLQEKSSHQEYLGAAHPFSEGPSATLSAGNTAPGAEKPAPLVAESRDRRMAPHLQLLLNALDALMDAGEISAFEVLGPPEASHLRQQRNGLPCWSFASEDQLREVQRGQAARGWEFIFEPPRIEGGAKRAYPRCLLVVRVQLEGHDVLIFEVEPRPSETAYRSYILEPTETVDSQAIETAVLVLRGYFGRLPPSGLSEAFRGLTRHQAVAVNHAYEKNDNGDIIAWNSASLRRQLTRAYRWRGAMPGH